MTMRRKAVTLLMALAGLFPAVAARAQPSRAEIERTMERATRFMVDRVATRGGYVWTYLPDLSRRWGEMEAEPGMIWVQAPGTATMGHVFLDAFHATGDEHYYRAASAAAGALIAGQHRSGGWNYFIHFGGRRAARRWYASVGRNGWRLEEFQHWSDNATFDDAGTAETMQLLLRLYLIRREPRFRAPLDRAIGFVLASQYPNGGWPQRFPYDARYPAYQSDITFNDDVAKENIRFLIMAGRALSRPELLEAARRGMLTFLVTLGRPPQAGWGLQYARTTLEPTGARTYEPRALVTQTSATNVEQLMEFFRLTGDARFLERIPEALAWLESVRLPAGTGPPGRRFPTFVELGTNRPLYVHRRGSNVVNGAYYVDHDPAQPIAHYSQFRAIDLERLRREFDRLRHMPIDQATRGSPLLGPAPFPRTFIGRLAAGSDFSSAAALDPAAIVRALNAEGWWPAPLAMTSHRYRGPGSRRPAPGDYRTSQVGDESDTSPFPDPSPAAGISTAVYIANMSRLILALGQ